MLYLSHLDFFIIFIRYPLYPHVCLSNSPFVPGILLSEQQDPSLSRSPAHLTHTHKTHGPTQYYDEHMVLSLQL